MPEYQPARPVNRQRGSALFITLLVMIVVSLLGLAFMGTALTESNVASNWRDQTEAFYLAEAGVESLYQELKTALFNSPGTTNPVLPTGASLQPGASRAPANSNFTFEFAETPPATRVATVRATAPFSYNAALTGGPYRGLRAIITDYEMAARVTGPRGSQARVSQVVQRALIPLFQFYEFTGKRINAEISPGRPMSINGRVHSNADVYLMTLATFTLDAPVTAAGKIFRGSQNLAFVGNNPEIRDAGGVLRALNFDHDSPPGFSGTWTPAEWKNQALTTFGGTVQDSAMGVGEIVPPIPDLLNDPNGDPRVISRQMIERGLPGDSDGQKAAKIYYQADLRIVDGMATDKNGNPVSLAGCGVSTNKTFYEKREERIVRVTEVDLRALADCGKMPANGILYVGDSATDRVVRLTNGSELPAGGLTVVSENLVYTLGDYNTQNKKAAAIMADGMTALSGNWTDSDVDRGLAMRRATDTTVNAALAIGQMGEIAPGVGRGNWIGAGIDHLEEWGSARFTYNGSQVFLWTSLRKTGKPNAGIYMPPNPRIFSYDTLFDTTLPPGTPYATVMIRGRWQG